MGGTKIEITSIEIALAALLKSKFRMTIVAPATIPYSAGTQTDIPLTYNDLLAKNSANDLAFGNVAAINRAIDAKYEQLRKQENSYFTVVLLKVKDDIYPESILVPFGIPAISRALPYNVSEIAAEGLVSKMLTGNNNIVSLALPLMVDYNYADTAAILAAIVILKGQKIALEVIAEETQSALQISEQAAKDLIVIMWAELDLYYLALKDGPLHDACRNWGVIYEADKVVTELSIKAKFAVSGLDANGAIFHVGKELTARGKAAVAGITATIEANGVVVLSTTQEGPLVITGKSIGCVDIVQPIVIVPGTNQAFNFTFVILPV